MELPADASGNHVVGKIAQALAGHNPSEAIAWAQSSPSTAAAYLDKASSERNIDPFVS